MEVYQNINDTWVLIQSTPREVYKKKPRSKTRLGLSSLLIGAVGAVVPITTVQSHTVPENRVVTLSDATVETTATTSTTITTTTLPPHPVVTTTTTATPEASPIYSCPQVLSMIVPNVPPIYSVECSAYQGHEGTTQLICTPNAADTACNYSGSAIYIGYACITSIDNEKSNAVLEYDAQQQACAEGNCIADFRAPTVGVDPSGREC